MSWSRDGLETHFTGLGRGLGLGSLGFGLDLGTSGLGHITATNNLIIV